jgi:hypothetical protein
VSCSDLPQILAANPAYITTHIADE